jgi:hypothetical protein
MGRSVSGLYVFATTLVVAAVAGVSCGTNLPGTTLGTYKVTGTLTGNMCGEGIDAPDPWQFDVQLSETASTMYLNWMDASPLLSGPRTSPTEATLSGYQVANVDATGATMGPCDLQRSDLVKIVLGVDTPPLISRDDRLHLLGSTGVGLLGPVDRIGRNLQRASLRDELLDHRVARVGLARQRAFTGSGPNVAARR